jgi:hypothetical protein
LGFEASDRFNDFWRCANDMFKKYTLVQWLSFLIVLAMVVVLFWLARYLERASF